MASPDLLDPNFNQTVVLLVDHREEGSLGFVVNRVADISFNAVVEELGLTEDHQAPPEVPVLVGGPVAPHTGWIVFDPRTRTEPFESAIEVNDRLQVSASRALLEELAQQADADRHLLVLGYASWGPGQLDQEIREGSWIPVDVEDSVVFDSPYDERWDAALSALGINPMQLVGTGTLGGATA